MIHHRALIYCVEIRVTGGFIPQDDIHSRTWTNCLRNEWLMYFTVFANLLNTAEHTAWTHKATPRKVYLCWVARHKHHPVTAAILIKYSFVPIDLYRNGNSIARRYSATWRPNANPVYSHLLPTTFLSYSHLFWCRITPNFSDIYSISVYL